MGQAINIHRLNRVKSQINQESCKYDYDGGESPFHVLRIERRPSALRRFSAGSQSHPRFELWIIADIAAFPGEPSRSPKTPHSAKCIDSRCWAGGPHGGM